MAHNLCFGPLAKAQLLHLQNDALLDQLSRDPLCHWYFPELPAGEEKAAPVRSSK